MLAFEVIAVIIGMFAAVTVYFTVRICTVKPFW